MKKIEPLGDFAKGGLNTDLPAHQLGGQFITSGKNFRCEDNTLLNCGGSLPVSGAINNNPGRLFHVRDGLQNYFVSCGTEVFSFDQNAWKNLNAPNNSSISDISKWSSAKLGRMLLLNNPGAGLFYWPRISATSTLLELPFDPDRTWSEANEYANIIRSHKSYGIALGLISDGEELLNGVRWSDPADNNDIPHTWDDTKPENLAGMNVLADEGGAISDGLSLRNNFIIYRENAIWNMQYTGGRFVWKFSKQSFNIGALSRECVAEVNGAHVVFGDGDIILYDGNSIKSIVNNRIRRRINSAIDVNNFKKSFVVQNKEAKEVWFCFCEQGEPEPNIAYIWGWENNTWGVVELSHLPHIAFGTISESPTSDKDNWESEYSRTWGSDNRPWNSSDYVPFDNTLIGTKTDGSLINLTPIANDERNKTDTYIERLNLTIESQTGVTSIDRLYPYFTGTGKVSIQIGSHDYFDGPVRWRPPVEFEIGKDRKIDVRTTGSLHAIRISTDQTSNRWRFSGADVEYTTAGKR